MPVRRSRPVDQRPPAHPARTLLCSGHSAVFASSALGKLALVNRLDARDLPGGGSKPRSGSHLGMVAIDGRHWEASTANAVSYGDAKHEVHWRAPAPMTEACQTEG